MEYGFIGESFSHNFSKTIHDVHESAGQYSYEFREMSPCQVESFIRERNFKGINVADACRKTVIPLLDEISDEAQRTGAVNTIVNRNGRLRGFNTDYQGLKSLILKTGLDLTGKKVMILGTGVTGRTAHTVVTDLGCGPVRMVSRTGKDGALSYEEIYEKYADAEILINTTPCGMYPDLDACPVDLALLPCIRGVIDVICDPLRTALVLEAEKRDIPAAGGLYMMAAGALRAAELFTDSEIGIREVDRIYNQVLNTRRNIVLTGMSLAGKTTVGTLLSRTLGRELADTDEMIIETEQRPITEIFAVDGEGYFRDVESEMTRILSPKTGMIIATGGGAILRPRNVDALKKNGIIIFLDRPLEQILPADDRPLANTRDKVVALHKKRYPIYCAVCDERVPNDISPEDVMAKILDRLHFPV